MAKNRAYDPRRVVGSVLSKLNENKGNLVGGNFSQFGGTSGASHDAWSDTPSRTGKLGGPQPADAPMRRAGAGEANTKLTKPYSWDGDADAWGRKGAMKKTEKYTTGPETNEQAAERGARMKVSPDVTILGDKFSPNHNRTPVSAENRATGNDIIAQNKKLGLDK